MTTADALLVYRQEGTEVSADEVHVSRVETARELVDVEIREGAAEGRIGYRALGHVAILVEARNEQTQVRELGIEEGVEREPLVRGEAERRRFEARGTVQRRPQPDGTGALA